MAKLAHLRATRAPVSSRVAYIGDAVPLPEKALIEEIRRSEEIRRRARSSRRKRAGMSARAAQILTGIGDDCAVLRLSPQSELLVTTDFSLEGIHFRRDWHPAESVGHRCLTRGLSDIAAMSGDPVAAFLSLALPRDLPQSWVKGFLRGLLNLARRYGVSLAGGDTAQSPDGILADIIVLGTAPKNHAILRSTARVGDAIYVTGTLGGSAAAIERMMAKPKKRLNPREYPQHFYPEPRLALGRILREKNLATAMIDLSDGLSTDLAHICEESAVGAQIEAASIPKAQAGKLAREVNLNLALHGGEDYELLFTARPGKRIPPQIAGVPLTRIGRITRARKIILINADGTGSELKPQGWEHFRA
jgi:thiamine-monophosphate kinase